MKKELTKKKYLIAETVYYIKNNYKNINFHIVSGSDQNEPKVFMCWAGIAQYFKSIHVKKVLENEITYLPGESRRILKQPDK